MSDAPIPVSDAAPSVAPVRHRRVRPRRHGHPQRRSEGRLRRHVRALLRRGQPDRHGRTAPYEQDFVIPNNAPCGSRTFTAVVTDSLGQTSVTRSPSSWSGRTIARIRRRRRTSSSTRRRARSPQAGSLSRPCPTRPRAWTVSSSSSAPAPCASTPRPVHLPDRAAGRRGGRADAACGGHRRRSADRRGRRARHHRQVHAGRHLDQHGEGPPDEEEGPPRDQWRGHLRRTSPPSRAATGAP